MKVILLQDVAKIGKKGDITTVPNGYALNLLIPTGKAEVASPENVKRLASLAAQTTETQAAEDASFNKALEAIADTTVTVSVEANEQGHLFEALKVDKIVTAFAEAGAIIAPDAIVLDAPIKECGTHTIVLKSGDSEKSLDIIVVSQ